MERCRTKKKRFPENSEVFRIPENAPPLALRHSRFATAPGCATLTKLSMNALEFAPRSNLDPEQLPFDYLCTH